MRRVLLLFFALIPILLWGQAPTISSFTPSSGCIGSVITITGTNFNSVMLVRFGGLGASSYTVNSSTQITATVSSGATGTVQVQTINGTGTSGSSFTYSCPAPTITSFTPTSGCFGTNVTISGTNFIGVSQVRIGGTNVSSYTVNSATQITATVSTGITGTVQVVAAGGTATSPGTYTFPSTCPTITSFTPSSGCINSSTVVIAGTNFTGATAVSIGGTSVTSFTVNSATQITATVGLGLTGKISVTTPVGSITSSGTFTFSPVCFSGLNSPYCANAALVTLTGSPSNGTFTGPGITDNANGTATFNPALAGSGGTVNYAVNYSWTSVSGAYYHTAAIKSDGTLWTWGKNTQGQLGIGNNTNQSLPMQVGVANDWVSVSVGTDFTLAIKSNGTLWAWGLNDYGQLGIGNTTNQNIPIQVGTQTNWAKVDAGYDHAMALKSTGTLWAWGRNYRGEVGNGNTTQQNSPIQIGVATDWTSIDAGYSNSFAIKSNGTLWGCGFNGYGQLGMGTTGDVLSGIVQIGTATNWASVAGGGYHSIAIKTNGTLWSCGYNTSGQLGLGNTTSQTTWTQVGSLTTWADISTGENHSHGLRTDGTLWAWGDNGLGQFGIGNTTNQNVPTQVGAATNWTSVDIGWDNTMALRSDGTLWGSGLNQNGGLGIGNTTNQNTLVSVNPVVTASQSVTVNAVPTPTISAGGATTFCSGGSVSLDAGSYSSYSWNAAGGNATTQSVTASASGTYTVTVTDANNCSASATQTVTVNSVQNRFFAMTTEGGVNNKGVIFEWDNVNNTYTKRFDFGGVNGEDPQGYLTQFGDKFYGMTPNGGAFNKGVIFEWDACSNVYTKKMDFDGTNGSLGYGSLTIRDGKFYGITNQGGVNNMGVIFEWDPVTNIYTKKVDMTGITGYFQGKFAYGNLTLDPNTNKFYGITTAGGAYGGPHGLGVVFEWDPVTNVYLKKADFAGSINPKGERPYGSMVRNPNNGNFYGMTYLGGSANKGVIFEWNPSTNTLSNKVDFTGTNGEFPFGNLTFDTNTGTFYGMTSGGGANNVGVIFEWNPSTNAFTKKSDFMAANGSETRGTFVLKGGTAYALTWMGGTSNLGVVFEWNPSTNTYTQKQGFSGTTGNTQGARPWYNQLVDFTPCATPASATNVIATQSTVCLGTTSNLNATSAGNNIRWYSQASGGTLLGTSTSGYNFPVTPSVTTTYYAEAYNATCNLVATSRTPVMVTVNSLPTPSITAGGATTFCSGGSVSLDAGAYSSYSWNAVAGNATTQTVTASTGGIYMVTVTAANGCSASASTVVTVNPCPTTGWTYTGSMGGPRRGHGLTKLSDGRVLATAGWNASSTLTSCEIYNPTTGIWSPTGSIKTGIRSYVNTILLQNGKVLMVGGNGLNLNTTYKTCELFNPSTGTWSQTGSLATARSFIEVVRLPNGRVLAIGGTTGNGAATTTNTCEIYNPATGTWSAAAPITGARNFSQAVLLANGKVLVIGGKTTTGANLNTCMLYDYTTNTWTATGTMATARVQHRAITLPNGKILVTGGESVSSCEIYDPALGTWSAAASLPAARINHACTLLANGLVLVAGGSANNTSGTAFYNTSLLYDYTTNTWTPTANLNQARYDCGRQGFEHGHCVPLNNGKILVAAGQSHTIVNTCELYTYSLPIPTISAFTPNLGCTGTVVEITGTNFILVSAVTIGGSVVNSFTVNSPTQITAYVGAGTTGAASIGAVTVTTPGGTATSTGTFTINPNTPPPSISSSTSTSVCAGVNVTLTASSAADYAWFRNGAFVNYSTLPSYTFPALAGNNTYTLAVTYAPGTCVSSTSASITVTGNEPVAVITPSAAPPYCLGAAPTLNATPPTGTGYTYSWICSACSTTTSGANYVPVASGNHRVIITDANGCSKSSDWLSVGLNALPAAYAGTDKSICSNTTTTIGSGTSTGVTYTWTPSLGLSDPTISNPSVTPTPGVSTTYTVTVTNSTTGCSKTDNVIVTGLEVPVADAGLDKSICLGSSTTLGAAAVPGVTYAWAPTTALSPATSASPTVTPTSTGTKTYTLTATQTAGGCKATDQVLVTVDPLSSVIVSNNRGLNFTGLNAITVNDPAQFNVGATTDFTFQGVIQTTRSARQCLFSKMIPNATPPVVGYQIWMEGSKLGLEFVPSSGNAVTVFTPLTPTVTLSDGQCHHVAIVLSRNPGNAKFYVDGVQRAVINTSWYSNNVDNTATVYIGRERQNFSHYYYQGFMDELAFFKRALTATEIAQNATTALSGTEPNLQAYWKFENGTPGGNNVGVTTLVDATGGNDGTLSGFALTGTTSNWVTSPCSIHAEACEGATNLYSAPAGISAYSWSVNGNATIIGATNGSSVSVMAGTTGNYTVSLATVPCASVSSSTVVISPCGISRFGSGEVVNQHVEEGIQNLLSAYPNPAAGVLNISVENCTDEEVRLQLYNAIGQLVMEHQAIPTTAGLVEDSFDISSLAAGVYTVTLKTSEGLKIQKVVKE